MKDSRLKCRNSKVHPPNKQAIQSAKGKKKWAKDLKTSPEYTDGNHIKSCHWCNSNVKSTELSLHTYHKDSTQTHRRGRERPHYQMQGRMCNDWITRASLVTMVEVRANS